MEASDCSDAPLTSRGCVCVERKSKTLCRECSDREIQCQRM